MSYAKAKGTLFESQVVKYLLDAGFESARRVALAGWEDKGDIHIGPANNPYFVIECKSYGKELPYGTIENFVEEAQTEFLHAKGYKSSYFALLFVKRVNLGVADSWVIWKNSYGITLRCRLGDLINPERFKESFVDEIHRAAMLERMLKDNSDEDWCALEPDKDNKEV